MYRRRYYISRYLIEKKKGEQELKVNLTPTNIVTRIKLLQYKHKKKSNQTQ